MDARKSDLRIRYTLKGTFISYILRIVVSITINLLETKLNLQLNL